MARDGAGSEREKIGSKAKEQIEKVAAAAAEAREEEKRRREEAVKAIARKAGWMTFK